MRVSGWDECRHVQLAECTSLNTGSLWWRIFIGPGKALTHLDYLFPARGQLHATARRRDSTFIHVVRAVAFWAVILVALAVAVTSIVNSNSQKSARAAAPYKANTPDPPTPDRSSAPPAAASTLPSQQGGRPEPAARMSTPVMPDTAARPPVDQQAPASGRALENTLDRLRATREQATPPPGGTRTGQTDNAQLSTAARGALGDWMRECWLRGTPPPGASNESIRIQITTDAAGVVREARNVSSSPTSAASAERAIRAALDPRCSTLPLPPSMRGSAHTFEITFRP